MIPSYLRKSFTTLSFSSTTTRKRSTSTFNSEHLYKTNRTNRTKQNKTNNIWTKNRKYVIFTSILDIHICSLLAYRLCSALAWSEACVKRLLRVWCVAWKAWCSLRIEMKSERHWSYSFCNAFSLSSCVFALFICTACSRSYWCVSSNNVSCATNKDKTSQAQWGNQETLSEFQMQEAKDLRILFEKVSYLYRLIGFEHLCIYLKSGDVLREP